MLRRKLYLAELLLSGAFLLVLVVSGLPSAARNWLASMTASQPMLVAAMFLLLSLSYGLLGLPLSYYGGFRLPHRFGLSRQNFDAWLWYLVKVALVGAVLGLIVVEVVYYLLAAFPDIWWPLAAVAMLFLTVVLSNLGPILLLPLFYKLKPLADADLVQRLVRLADAAGTRVRGVYTMDMSSKTTAANAALMGLGNTRRIVLGDTLLAQYDADEIETVLAHELAHHVHGDIPKGIALQSGLTLVSFYLLHLALHWAVGFFGYEGATDVAAMPLLGLIVGGFGVVVLPLANAFSRHIENQADRYALQMTGKPRAFASAMIKLADQNLAEFSPPRWVELLLYDHPSTARRVRLAQGYDRK